MKSTIRKSLLPIAVVCAGAAFTACDDYLDMPSYTEVDEENMFANDELAERYIEGCYRGIIHSEQWYQYNTGGGVVHSSEDSQAGSKYAICNYDFNTQDPYTLNSSYKEGYRVIEACNLAISRLGERAGSAKVDQLIGEAKVLRAFVYLNLIRMYGDVPATWIPRIEADPNDPNLLYPCRESRDVIYDHIIADMQASIPAIPWKSESDIPTNERITKASALAILARTALYAGGYSLRWDYQNPSAADLRMARRSDEARVRELYQIASDACQQIMQHGENGLVQGSADMSGYQTLFYNFCQRNFSVSDTEILWHLAELGTTTNSDFPKILNIGSDSGSIFGRYKALQIILPTYYLSFQPGDTRRDVVCANYSVASYNSSQSEFIDLGTTYTSVCGGKMRLQWCTEYTALTKRNVNIPVIRYAEVLLMYAEAQNWLNQGPTAEAKAALQQLRDRAGIGSLPIPADYQGFEDALVQERKWEMGDEMTLRTDLARMGRLAAEVRQTQQDMKELSSYSGKYADVAQYRIYKVKMDEQKWGDRMVSLEYIDITDPAEIALIKTAPSSASKYPAFLEAVGTVVAAHGVAYTAGEWYPQDMFLAYNASYNTNCRKSVGITTNSIMVGTGITQTRLLWNASNGQYPAWVYNEAGGNGIYYGFRENCSEILPFAASQPGHPIIDNPNLTQHPGFLN